MSSVMPRKKQEEEEESNGVLSQLKQETIRGVIAVIFFVIALFLVLAAIGMAGVAGDYSFRGLWFLFGLGYYLLPLVLVFLIISIYKDRDEKQLNLFKIVGSILFVLAGLGLTELFFGRGGIIGTFVSSPLVLLMEFWATILILVGLLVVSLMVIFDTHIRFNFSRIKDIFLIKKEDEDDEYDEEDFDEDEEADDEGEEDVEEDEDEDLEEEDDEEVEDDEEEEKPSRLKKMLGLGGSDEAGDDSNVTFTPIMEEYNAPPVSLLAKDKGKPQVGDTKANANIIKRTLQNFGIRVEMDEISVGPTVTRYALKPAEGVRISKIVSLQSNLELALAASPIRIEAPIPGKSLVGIEVPNSSKATISLASLLNDSEFKESTKPLLACIGRDITGNPLYSDIAKMPHGLIAGTTGSGKSVTIHSIVTSLLYRNGPQNLRFIMVDPKRVELTLYNDIPHLLTPVIKQPKQAIQALKWAANEMDRRYNILETERVRDISSYHQNVLGPAMKEYERKKRKLADDEEMDDEDMPETMPYIVVLIDELADIMQAYPRELEAAIVRLAQMSRAVGIHLILSTQRPSVNVITGLIKANVPSRLALQVSSQIDSRTILDTGGAEKLLGAGDMLYLSGEMAKPRRVQSPYISEEEVKKVVDYLAKNNDTGLDTGINLDATDQSGNAMFSDSLDGDDGDDDPKYAEAKELVIHAGKASTSYLQRKMGIGYSRAAKIMDILEERGVIGPQVGSKPREVLVGPDEEEEGDDEEYEEDEEGYEEEEERER